MLVSLLKYKNIDLYFYPPSVFEKLENFSQKWMVLSESESGVILLSHDGYYRQVDGLDMGIPPASLLANGWLSKFDHTIKGDANFSLDIRLFSC